MKQRGSGSILNIGWDQAATGMEGDSGEMFATTKGAVMAFTLSLAKSLAPEVRVNCIAPGWIKTDWGEEASDYWQQRAIGESLLQRWGTPEDIAKAARFLASDEATFINGPNSEREWRATMTSGSPPNEHIHFVTGRLAQHALENLVPTLAEQVGFAYSIDVLPITVAALMSPEWIAKHLAVPDAANESLDPRLLRWRSGAAHEIIRHPV